MKRAFTLLELMIVVIIVGLLASFAMPRFQGAIERSKWTGAIQILGAIRRTCEIYYSQFGDYPPGDYRLNGSSKNCPTSLDIGIPAADGEGRYLYQTSAYPYCAAALHDINKNDTYNIGEPTLSITYNNQLQGIWGAPTF